mmetsp:Transcript_35746/g.100625  ORF Transcript_35746/g.100625 Transcript_35746/m.100625 type:complete len:264 (+) Transcript_35746:20-811(+)
MSNLEFRGSNGGFNGWCELFVQQEKPDWHSYVIFASHLSFVACLYSSWSRVGLVERLSLIVTSFVSLFYHLCDEFIFCFIFNIRAWHALDVFLTFFLVTLFCVHILDVSADERILLRASLSSLSLVLLYLDRFSVTVNVVLWSVPAVLLASRFLFQTSRQLRWKGETVIRPRPPRVNRIQLVLCLALLAVGIVCFVAGNFVQVSSSTCPPHSSGSHSADAPETGLYWMFHSSWHIVCMLVVDLLARATQRDLEDETEDHFLWF